MIERHPYICRQVATHLGSEIHQVIEDFERRPIERTNEVAPLPNQSPHLNWELLLIWSFVAISFAVFFFCGYVIYVKCHGDWPY